MSAPAHKVAQRPAPSPRTRPPARRAAPERVSPRKRPAAPSQRVAKKIAKRTRSRSTLAFAVATSVIVALMVLGLVALQALLAQSSFQIDDLQSRMAKLTQTNQQLSLEAARLSSPSRIAIQARNIGMTLPAGGIQVLHVPDGSPHPARASGRVVGGRP